MIDYFDLNKRYKHSLRSLSKTEVKGKNSSNGSLSVSMSFVEQLVIYLSVLVGVFFSSSILQYLQTSSISFSIPTIIEIIFYSVISIVVFPTVYTQVVSIPPKPIFVQIGVEIQNGVFYQYLRH